MKLQYWTWKSNHCCTDNTFVELFLKKKKKKISFKPIIGSLSSFSYNSIVLNYGIATYLVALHRYPIWSSIGMIWLSPIPIPHDLWLLTLGMLHTWQHSIQFPHYPGTLVYGMGMLWGFGNVPYNSHIMLAHNNDTAINEMVNFHAYNLHIIVYSCRYMYSCMLHLVWEWNDFSHNSRPVPYIQWTATGDSS